MGLTISRSPAGKRGKSHIGRIGIRRKGTKKYPCPAWGKSSLAFSGGCVIMR